MGDRLTGIPALIHNHAETTIFEAEVTGNLDRHHEEVTGKRRVRFIKFRDPTDVANRDNEDVRRCLWRRWFRSTRLRQPGLPGW